MSKEVAGLTAQLILTACRQAGLAVSPLLEGLPIREDDLADPSCRISWEDFVRIAERGLAATGSDQAFEEAMLEVPRLLSPPGLCQELFQDVRTFFIWMVSSLPSGLHSLLQTTTHIEPDGKIVCEHHIPQAFAPSRALAIASAGLFRGAPRVFGQADALVDYTFDERCALYRITLPPPEGRVPRTSLPCDTPFNAHYFDDIQTVPWMLQMGRAILETRTVEELGSLLARGLHERTGCTAGALWVRHEHEGMARVFTWGTLPPSPERHMLALGTRILGLVEAGSSLQEAAQVTDELLRWATLALDRLPRREHTPDATRHDLATTLRQQQVLQLLAHGLSDKEIAQVTDTSPKTVGHQVSALLHRAGVPSRTALAALYLSDPPDEGGNQDRGRQR